MSTAPLTPRAQRLLSAVLASLDGNLETWLASITPALDDTTKQYCRERVTEFNSSPTVETLEGFGFDKEEAQAMIDAYFAETEEAEAPVVEVRETATSVTGEAKPAPQSNDLDQRYREYCDYLRAIFRPGDTLCFVSINHAKGVPNQVFATLEDALTRESFDNLLSANANASIYVAMNTFPADLVGQTKGRTQENVVAVRALQADMDDAQQAANIVSAMQSSVKVPPPSLVVESSTGKRQGIWLVDGISKEEAKPLMQAIAAEFNTDSAVAEVARVMRVPGFVNRKYDTSPIAKLLVNTAVRYTRDAFKVDAAATEKLAAREAPEEYLNAPFIQDGGPYGGIDNQVIKIIGHYSAKNIHDADAMFDLVKGHIERNGCYYQDGVTPYPWKESEVHDRCRQKTKEWEAKQQRQQVVSTNEALDKANKIAEQAAALAATLPAVTTPQQWPPQQPDEDSAAALQAQASEAQKKLDEWLSPSPPKEGETAPEIPVLSSNDVIGLLSLLDAEAYEDRRARTAKKLGWRSSALDSARMKVRAKFVAEEEEDDLQGRAFVLEESTPWEQPVNIAEVLDEIEKTLRRFVFFQREEDLFTVTLWTVMTWLSGQLAITPYLGVRSPEKGCGKSTLLKLISKLVYHPLAASNCTAAAMFRLLELHTLTLLIDELDTFMEYSPEVLNVFNSGHSRELAFVLRCVGDDAEARAFNTFGAKAYGMIGNATDTLESRSLSVVLFPKIEEDGIEDLNFVEMPELVAALQVLSRKLARWANDNTQAVLNVKPDMKGTVNRKRDNWRPLFQIAEFAGHGWLDKARKAAGIKDVSEEKNLNRQFLEDVRNILFKRNYPKFMPSNVLLADLHAQLESGWKEYGRGHNGMTQNDLGVFMKGYGVKSDRDYLGGCRVRGYHSHELFPAFDRFLRNVTPEDVELGNVGMPTDAVNLGTPPSK